jgi:hypothetical protein
MTSIKKTEKEKINTFDVTFFLDVFWTTAWAFLNKIKSYFINIFSIIYAIFIYLIHSIKIVCHNVKNIVNYKIIWLICLAHEHTSI